MHLAASTGHHRATMHAAITGHTPQAEAVQPLPCTCTMQPSQWQHDVQQTSVVPKVVASAGRFHCHVGTSSCHAMYVVVRSIQMVVATTRRGVPSVVLGPTCAARDRKQELHTACCSIRCTFADSTLMLVINHDPTTRMHTTNHAHIVSHYTPKITAQRMIGRTHTGCTAHTCFTGSVPGTACSLLLHRVRMCELHTNFDYKPNNQPPACNHICAHCACI